MTHSRKIIPTPYNLRNFSILAMSMTGVLLLTSCASSPKAPDHALQAAMLAISNAEKARVVDYASPELSEARNKLAAANTAVADKKMVLALYLADEARVNAELATARADQRKAKAVNDEMQKNINTLKQEMQRNTGVR